MKKLLLLFAFFFINLQLLAQTWEDCNSGRLDSNVQDFFFFDNKLYSLDSKKHTYYLNNDDISWTQLKDSISDKGLFIIKQVGDKLFAATFDDGVYRSLDNGNTWQTANNGLPKMDWLCDFVNIGDDLFLGYGNLGVYHSSDFGDNWTLRNNKLPTNRTPSLAVLGDAVFAGTYGKGVYRSTNKGQDWTFSGLPGSIVFDLLTSGNKLYAGDQEINGGMSVTENGGLSWAKTNAGLMNKWVINIAKRGNMMSVATFGGGVYLSYDEGTSWNQVNYNLPSKDMICVVFWKNYLYAGTIDKGLYRLDLNLLGTEEVISDKFINVFPNPASDFILINLYNFNSKFTPVSLRLINQFGENVLEEQIFPGSEKLIRIDTKNIAAGIYFLMLKSADKAAISKVIINQ